MKESILIDKIYAKLKSPESFGGFGGIGDDSIQLPIDGLNESLVLSTDSFVEGTHFNHEVSFKTVGWKSLVSSLSDIYAMGVQPSFYTLNLVLPKHFKEQYFDDFLDGMLEASTEYNVKIVGGDIAKGPCFIAAFQVGGYARTSQVKSLKGAQKGDVLFTNAGLGYAKLGFEDFKFDKTQDFNDSEFKKAFLRPELNKELSLWLGSIDSVTAMTDISDGLLSEIETMLLNKDLKFQLDELKWTSGFEKACKLRGLNPEKTILEGGEEYGLLWAIKTDVLEDFISKYKLKFKSSPQMLGNFVLSKTISGNDKIIYHNKKIFNELKRFNHF